MGAKEISCRHVMEELIDMGFEHSQAEKAVKEVGPLLNDAANYILNGNHWNSGGASTTLGSYTDGRKRLRGKSSINQQSSFLDHFTLNRQPEASVCNNEGISMLSGFKKLSSRSVGHCVELGNDGCYDLDIPKGTVQVTPSQLLDFEADLEKKLNSLLRRHFGHESLKSFQREALAAWSANHDCLTLAATGSGKSLCFQIPALLTGKVVVPDSSVEKKAMNGIYSIVYICPETVLRLIKPLQGLAAGRGIALFAIDEAHCVSKWGHDFRPDYRRLSVLRQNFSSHCLEVLKSDIPVMALTATATKRVQHDIIKCLCMSNETKVVLTSFYRPNLRFSVKHSKTSSAASYKRDFSDLILIYHVPVDSNVDGSSDGCGMNSAFTGSSLVSDRTLSVEFLEDEEDVFHCIDDWDVSCGEFSGKSLGICADTRDSDELVDPLMKPGPTIIYVPTRKETLRIAKFLSENDIKAAAYHAGLPKAHLRHVHNEFLEDHLEVVVATMAFGMGIDKSNVRRIIHYGWPQSLEAYYQEAGRAGRDGRLADCILYANLSLLPTLLPSRRSEEQKNWAHEMLSDCHRYGMNTPCCRAKKLVEYFGEDFNQKCLLCDVCTEGPPKPLNVTDEVYLFLQILAAVNDVPHHIQQNHRCMGKMYRSNNSRDAVLEPCSHMEKPNLRTIVSKIREQSQKYITSDVVWWRGVARVLESEGYIKEGDGQKHVQIKYPEITEWGMDFLQSHEPGEFTIFPEADMLLSAKEPKANSSFSEWGKGWADPEIRRERLKGRHKNRRARKQTRRVFRLDPKTTRGRLAAKIKGKGERS
ncbi:hypothetical protein MLD38_016472 [Melastoma candidum]|uniref:Uncharacterized protein n=1 Tax=Melastoma candidum TaxID=119954 RepID=A0ACB9QRK0_9MYRT|nr:hypothetical protein MLD38_016472 [Melastoma candidum]